MKSITILGASGHGKVIADIASLVGYDKIEFLDDNAEVTSCGPYPVVGPCSLAEKAEGDIFVAIGNCVVRKKLMETLSSKNFPVLIHPSATVARDTQIGEGTAVMAGAVINPGCVIGKGNIINTCCSVDHDCVTGDYVHVSVGAHLCGTVNIEELTWVGAGAIVNCYANICSGCMIGAGAVVIKSITEKGTYIGIPAKIKSKEVKIP